MSFAKWLDDVRWARNMFAIRRFRRSLGFSNRIAFDDALRPAVSLKRKSVIAYPDAVYYVSIKDFCRAIEASHRVRDL
jgi:hypothetical protein